MSVRLIASEFDAETCRKPRACRWPECNCPGRIITDVPWPLEAPAPVKAPATPAPRNRWRPEDREAVRRVLDKLTEPGVRTLDGMVDEILAALQHSETSNG